MPNSIGAIIQQWLRENGLDDKLKEQSVPTYWVEIVGETIAKHATVDRIDKGTMFISVQSATWRNEIMLRREEIKRKVNERFGAEVVQEIVVR